MCEITDEDVKKLQNKVKRARKEFNEGKRNRIPGT